eukprot:TRINITY_DN91904_c0_g1_i1.p1 TRINITY_DN91904_c0_g1~~TRINITY_DN91904_c0_g1_i1.p1  ORF type:complete len:109 (-),score=26.46 TRINITY_DN91904_c0_g1_i1:4-300(-)
MHEVDGEACQLDILDTAGQEEFSNVQDEHMRNGQGFVLVYSTTSSSSLEDVKQLQERIQTVRNGSISNDTPIILVGTKIDLVDERAVAKEEGEELAQR